MLVETTDRAELTGDSEVIGRIYIECLIQPAPTKVQSWVSERGRGGDDEVLGRHEVLGV